MRIDDPTGGVFSILIVCTGNICRSPLAERLGRAYLDDALGNRAGQVQLSSAGTHAVVGSAMHPDSALVLQGFGGDPADFIACPYDESMAADADLTLTMTRAHRRAVLQRAPRTLARTFTLPEAADLLQHVAQDAELDGRNLPDRARALVRALAAARPLRSSTAADDVADPIGQPLEVHQEVGERIAAALIPLLGRIVALAPLPARDERDRQVP